MQFHKFFKVTRRTFLKLTGISSAAIVFSNPAAILARAAGRAMIRNDLGVVPDNANATGYSFNLLNIAQVSDVHIVDDCNPLRFENLKLCGKVPLNLSNLDNLIQSISRDQDTYSARIWNATISSINQQHLLTPMDFVISTGDHTDTGIEKELSWYIELADGYKSDTFQIAVDEGCIEDVDPEGFNLPWYAVLGNHDIEYEGTANNEIVVNALVPLFGAETEDLCDQDEAIEKYKTSTSDPWWHGFEHQPPQAYYQWQGYYSFDTNAYVHCIVLNTANYNIEGSPPRETFSLGILDQNQYDWMVADIEANSDKLCLVFSHHSPVTSFLDAQSDIPAEQFMRTLCSYDNVIGHITGHSHINRIDPVMFDDIPGGYWDINTCAIIEWPQEWRNITLRDNGDGTGKISCAMIQHDDQESLGIAFSDEDAQHEMREGQTKDRNVALAFAIPASVKETILANPPENGTVQPEENNNSGATNGSGSGSDSRCFIATAAYGSPWAADVMTLRRFRDRVLYRHLPGRLFIRTYYHFSPGIAGFISSRPRLQSYVRYALFPLITVLNKCGFSI
ncbi:MAG: metallophosphoesterase [Deltaproteobacteria bacterium]|nr:metallophosphoesterase [Deltaproteobacteria bacterium]